jgi:DNA topoisomerase-1
MKINLKVLGDMDGKLSHTESGKGIIYEVSRGQADRHKKLFAPIGTSLITPSGERVPSAWTEVWITTDPGNSIQSTGRDSKGRRVYLYSTDYMGRAAAAKFSRLRGFAKVNPSLIRKVRRDLKNSEAALILYLISKTGFRIGSNSETRARVKAFGASTLWCSHVTIKGELLSFEFTGKKGVRVNKKVQILYIEPLADYIFKWLTSPGYKITFSGQGSCLEVPQSLLI